MEDATNNTTRQFEHGAKIREYLNVVLRRKWIILILIASVLSSTIFYVQRLPDVYESFSVLVVEEPTAVLSQTFGYRTTGRSLSFYEGIINSRTFIETLIDSIGIELFEAALPKLSREGIEEYVRSNLHLRKTSYTSFLQMTARAPTRELAYFVATTSTEHFQRRCREVESEESRRTMVEIDKQLDMTRAKLEAAEREYRTFREKAGDLLEGTPTELKTLQEAYAQDLAQLGLKEADLTAEKAQLRKLESHVAPNLDKRSPEVLRLRRKLNELEKERLRLENLGIRFSGISTIDRQISEIEKELLRHKKSAGAQMADPGEVRQWQELRKSVVTKEQELALFRRRLDSYKKAISEYKSDNPDMLSQSLEMLRLKRSKEVFENIYEVLLKRAEEERLRSAASGAGIKVVDIAQVPQKPISKNETRYYIFGILLGLGLGLGAAFLTELNDTSIKSTEDIENATGMPVLGTIPHISHSKKNAMTIRRNANDSQKKSVKTQYPRQLQNFSGDDSISSEAYRSLRTNLTFVSPDDPVRCVAFTSAGPGEGKSLTVANLAMAYAQMGRKTLLVEADIRRPVVHHLFGVSREPGLSDLFTEESPNYEKTIRPSSWDNLFIVSAGMFSPNPAELIGSQKMGHHIEYFRSNFDMVLFDTPPVLAVTDAALLGNKTDGVVLVVRSNHTAREPIRRATAALRNVGIKTLGTVLNDIDLNHGHSAYGYYKYYYHYYKTKHD